MRKRIKKILSNIIFLDTDSVSMLFSGYFRLNDFAMSKMLKL